MGGKTIVLRWIEPHKRAFRDSAMDAEDLAYLSATELVDAYRDRSLSPVEVTRTVLARIDALNPTLNAFVLVDHESAMRDARASEARWMQGTPAGPVDGVPVSIKDLLLARGWPTLRGSRTVDPDQAWDVDAPSTARLRESGAVLLGKTATPEFGWRGSTDSPLSGITRNPWDLSKTPGGSSGGAVSAIAAGLGALATGTDGGGSIRIPAAFTGTVGIKAHFGRVPAWPLSPMGTVAHVGPQTRTVQDAALMLDVLARPDPRDWMALPPRDTSWAAALAGDGDGAAVGRAGRLPAGTSLKGLRIAYSPRLGYVPHVDPEIEAGVAAAAKVFAQLGATVEQVDPGIPDSAGTFAVHWFSSARHLLHRLPPEQFALLDPGLRDSVEFAARYTIADYLDAQNARGALAVRLQAFHQSWDLLLTPGTAVLPFDVGRVMPEPPPGVTPLGGTDWTWWTPFSFPFNLTQQPALVMGCGFSRAGLPLSLQLVAPNHREDLCLRAARAYEQVTPWGAMRPPVG
jgi:aspartyl-tRNA(Asn)/glutamyl-tRNA(Gln) amidotransferase subunit A